MSMRGAVAGCVVLVCLMALLVEKTGGHITFFSPKELMLMKVKQEREGKKDMQPRSQDAQFEEITVQQVPQMEHGENPKQTIEIAVRLSPEQLDRVTPVLEEIIYEITQEHQEAK